MNLGPCIFKDCKKENICFNMNMTLMVNENNSVHIFGEKSMNVQDKCVHGIECHQNLAAIVALTLK